MSADLDREIDRAVRAMLDREPPALLRSRVLSSIEGGDRRWSIAPFAIPAGALAIAIVLWIVLAPGRAVDRPVQISAGSGDVHLPPPAGEAVVRPHGSPTVAPRVGAAVRRQRHVVAAAVAHSEPVDPGIDALASPAPLSVGTLPAPATSTLSSIQPAPLRVTALDVPALEMPPNAARGVER